LIDASGEKVKGYPMDVTKNQATVAETICHVEEDLGEIMHLLLL